MAVVGHRHRLGEALGLVVHAARADRVDVAPVRLRLRVHLRVAVDLAGRGEEEPGVLGLGQAEAVVRAQAADLQDLDRDALEVDRRRRAGEVHDRVDLAGHPHVLADVVLDEREPAVAEQLLDVGHGTGDEVVDGDDTITAIEQRPAEVRAEEAGAAGDDDARHGQRPMPWYSKPARRHSLRSSRLRASTTARPGIASRHLGRVEPAVVVPLGEHDEHVGALDGGVRVVTRLDVGRQPGLGTGDRRVVATHDRHRGRAAGR